MSQMKLHRVTAAQVDALQDDEAHPWSRQIQALMSEPEGGYVVTVDEHPVGAVWRNPSVTATYWGAWRGTGRIRGVSRREVVEDVVARAAARAQ